VAEADGSARGAYDEWHARLQVDESVSAPWHEEVKPLLGRLQGLRVLEIGCGRGGFAAWLAAQPDRPAELVAADFSPVAVRMAEEFGLARGTTGVTYRVEDLMGLTFPDASFDAAISFETIEHVPDSRRALRELARVLKPGGTLFLTCPNYLNLTGLHRIYRVASGRGFSEEGQPINHFLVFPRVLRWVQRAGFDVEQTRGVGHYVPFPRRPPIRLGFLDRLRPLRLLAHHSIVIARRR
jgi:ubiquinone/menaquinone biosynthesis C-methylase UbiE